MTPAACWRVDAGWLIAPDGRTMATAVRVEKLEEIRAALNEVEALRARVAELERDAVDKAAAWDAISGKNARIAELEAALRPFAEWAGNNALPARRQDPSLADPQG